MAKYAIVGLGDSIVNNIVSWNGDTSTWKPPTGYQAIGIGSVSVGIGDSYTGTGTEFISNKPEGYGIIIEDKALILRTKRDQLLSDTDWLVIKGIEDGVGISTEWKNYRQSLRDLPTGITTVVKHGIVLSKTPPWPTPPT